MTSPTYNPAPKAAIKSKGIWGNVLALLSLILGLAVTYNSTGTIPQSEVTLAITTAAPIVLGLIGRIQATRPIGGLFSSGENV